MFMRTPRLFLRPAWLEDVPELTRAIGQEPVVRMLARAHWPYREEDARAFVNADHTPHLPNLLVTLPEEGGRIVGGCGLHDDGHGTEIGYWIEPASWNRGFATEAVRGLLSVAHMAGHRRVLGRHAADNPASGRVLRKAGFCPTGRSRACRSLSRAGTVETTEYAIEFDRAGPCGDAPMPKAA